MADLEEVTTPMEIDNSSDSDSSSDEQPVQQEWLATSRAKRSTAGTRMTSLIQQEAEDDELELLFAEDENDDGFEMEGGDDSDVQMDSSDDDDDNGPPAPGVEELDGEKELQRKERAERMQKKRKNDHLPKSFQSKRVKTDPLAPKKTPPRPKKKSERSSWIPTQDDAPVRVSHRATTRDAKERLYKEMEEREKKRLKQLENMERAAAVKAAQKRPEKTQEDRLAEAARVEKANAKSLNRWEEAERIREEEARARLEALHNRKMEGPVLTWWSGMATYVGDKLKQVGKNVTVEEAPVKAPRKKRPSEMGIGNSATAQARLERQASLPKVSTSTAGQASANSSGPVTPSTPSGLHGSVNMQAPHLHNPGGPSRPTLATPAMLNGSAPLSGLSAPPSAPGSPFPQSQLTRSPASPNPAVANQLPPPPSTPAILVTPTNQTIDHPARATPLPQPFNTTSAIAGTASQAPYQPLSSAPSMNVPNQAVSNASTTSSIPAAQPSAGPMPPIHNAPITGFQPQAIANAPAPSLSVPPHNALVPLPKVKSGTPPSMPPPSAQPSFSPQQTSQPSQLSLPQPHAHTASSASLLNQPITHATSNRLILTSISDTALKDKSTINAILFHGNRFHKLGKTTPPPICVITGMPAKFKDPKTGLPYSNAFAFKEIRRLERGEYRWSALLGAYVGGVERTAGSGAQVKVNGAARGVPGRFVDPKAPAPVRPPPPPQPQQTLKKEGLGTPGSGSMAPPPLPHMPSTPTPMGTGTGQILTPGQFAAQRMGTPIHNPNTMPKPFVTKMQEPGAVLQTLHSVMALGKPKTAPVSAPQIPATAALPVATFATATTAAAPVAAVAAVAPIPGSAAAIAATVPSPAQPKA